MEFGKVNAAQLAQVDFRLPDDPISNRDVLAQGKGNTQFYIGCARWGNKDWVGKYYPKGTKDKDFLREYAKLFNCIELNATYYGTPSLAQIASWKEKAGDHDFLFCPKLPQVITHNNKLRNSVGLVSEFVYSMAGLGVHAGPVFVMPDPQMDVRERGIIEQFIADFPEGVPLFLEVRHPSFYTAGYDDALYSFLRNKEKGTVITDTAGRRDCVHMHLSVPEVFIRFVGNALHPTDYQRIDDWVTRLGSWMEMGIERVFFIIHQSDELYAPPLIAYLMDSLNSHHGTSLKAPQPLTQPTLF
jgi:uncharacterized protein YecE (DUF72 family)